MTDRNTTFHINSKKPKRYVSVACVNCQKRRRKCDGGNPCKLCSSLSKECVYQIREDKRRKTYLAGKIQVLEDQNRLLKSLVEKFIDKDVITDPNYLNYLFSDPEDNVNNQSDSSLHFKSSDSEYINGDISLHDSKSEQNMNQNFHRAVEDLTGMIWKLEINSSNTTKFVGPSSNRISKLENKIDYKSSLAKGTTILSCLDVFESGENSSNALKQDDFLKKLLHIYKINFVEYNLSLQHFNFNLLLDEYLIDSEHGISELEVLFLYSIFAYSFNLLPSDDPNKVLLGSTNQFLIEVESCILIILRDFNNIEWESQKLVFYVFMTLTALHLGDNDECLSWSYNSLLCAQMIHLGLHVNSWVSDGSKVPEDEKDLELVSDRHILFWNCTLFDKLSTTILGRSSLNNTRRVLIDFYVSDDPTDEKKIIFQYDTKLLFIYDKYMDEIYSFHYDQFEDFKKLILLVSALKEYNSCYNEFLALYPISTVDLKTASIPVLLLHLKYHVCLLFFYRPYIQIKDHASSIFWKCLSALNTCIMLVRSLDSKFNYYEYPFYYGYLLSSILIFMELLFTIDHFKTSSLHNAFILILNSLKKSSKLWPSFHIYIDSLFERAKLWNLDDKILLEFFSPISEVLEIEDDPNDVVKHDFDEDLDALNIMNNENSINKVFGLDEESSMEFIETARFLDLFKMNL